MTGATGATGAEGAEGKTGATGAEGAEGKEGADSALWSWGAMHTITFRHSLDQLPGAKRLFDLGPVSRPGDGRR